MAPNPSDTGAPIAAQRPVVQQPVAARIAVATSIPPILVRSDGRRDIGKAYQRHCIESWLAAGFKIVSLNFPDEIPDLARQYPEVTFLSLSRNEATTFGHKTPLLAELLQALSQREEGIVGIINADIFLEEGDWAGVIRDAAKGAIAVAHRYNVQPQDRRNPRIHPKGYDLFFFERKEIPAFVRRHFAMGVPWWDYCLPLAFELKGLPIRLLTRPRAFHLRHPDNFKLSTWRRMAKEFAEFVLDAAAAPGARVTNLSPVIRLCERVASDPDGFEESAPSALATAWQHRLPGPIGRLPAHSRWLAERLGRDRVRHRLSKASAVAISAATVAAGIGGYRSTSYPSLPFLDGRG